MKPHLASRTSQGSVLLVCLCVAVVIGIGLVSCLVLVEHQNLMVARSQAWNGSLVVAEAGIEDGLALINKNAGTLADPGDWADTAWADSWTQSGNLFHIRRYIGSNYYDVYVTNANDQPVIKAVGTVLWNSPSAGTVTMRRAVVVQTIPASMYQGGVIARDGVNISGNTLIDSFNSQNTNYSSNGQYVFGKHKDNGNVATTESNVVAAVDASGSVLIYGKIYTGPNDTVKTSGQVSVGSTNWVPTVGIQTNWLRNDLNITIQDAPPPPPGIPLPAMTSNTVNGTNYNNSIYLPTGDYQTATDPHLSSSQSIIVQGNVSVYFQAGLTLSGQSYIYITPGSSLTLYSAGTVNLSGGGVMNGTGYATNLTLYGTPACASVSYSGGSALIGTTYAPEAAVNLSGGSSLVGSVVAGSLSVSGGFQIHYDESLQAPAAGADFYVTSWQEVPP